MFNQVLDPVLRPLLEGVGPFWALLIISIFVSLLTTIVYKYATDQTKLKSLKADLKRYQKKLTANKDNPEKALKIQKDVMRLNGDYMKQSLKSTLYTFLPIILFFGWLQASLAFAPLLPDELFDVTLQLPEGVEEPATLILVDGLTSPTNLTQSPDDEGMITWALKGAQGLYALSIQIQDEEQFFSVLITEQVEYENPITEFKDSQYFETITVGNEKLLLFDGIPVLGSIPWIKTFGWFGAYFLFSIIFSTALRKALKLA